MVSPSVIEVIYHGPVCRRHGFDDVPAVGTRKRENQRRYQSFL